MKQSPKKYTQGQVMLTVVIFFLLISMTIVLGIANPILKQVKISQDNYSSKKSYYAATGAIEDAHYRLVSSKTIGSTESIVLNGGGATTTITTTATGKQFVAAASVNSAVRKIQANFALGTGVAFHYGVQSGLGGFRLNNSSSVVGNIFSSGSVIGATGNMVYGDVISAGPTGLVRGIRSTSSVYAHTIGSSSGGGTTVDRDAYYQVKVNTTVGGTNYPGSADQATTSLPISDEQISEWESDAAAGGTMLSTDCSSYSSSTNTCTISSDKTIGPLKIPFNLTISGNSTVVTINGPLWVTGNISISKPLVRISPTLGSKNVPIIADDPSNRTTGSLIDVGVSSTFSGSGSPGSFVFLISQNNSSETGGSIDAITLGQGASALVVYASHGQITLNQSVSVKEVTAYKTILNNSAQVIYDTGLPSTVFASGPSGGYEVVSWGEI